MDPASFKMSDYLQSGVVSQPLLPSKSADKSASDSVLVSELCFAQQQQHQQHDKKHVETAFGRMLGIAERRVELLECSGCSLFVHNTCYGVNEATDNWTCDACKQLKRFSQNQLVSCCLCGSNGGALKRTTNRPPSWCHIVCAIVFPDVRFQNFTERGPIDVSGLDRARTKLSCVYCSHLPRENRGACVQCKCGKCTTAFHVTCSFHNGAPLFLGDWPVLVEMVCPAHLSQRKPKKEEKDASVSVGDMVIAKHKNGRFYHARVIESTPTLYYKVVFEDKSFCFDLPPGDIKNVDASETIVRAGETVDVYWPLDDTTYPAEVIGHWFDSITQVLFEDGSVLNLKRSDFYSENEDLPKRVKTKLSYASETQNKFYLPDTLESSSKRSARTTDQAVPT